MDEETA